MCQSRAQGGVRCAAHLRGTIARLSAAHEAANRTDIPASYVIRKDLASAYAEYAATPTGMREMLARQDETAPIVQQIGRIGARLHQQRAEIKAAVAAGTMTESRAQVEREVAQSTADRDARLAAGNYGVYGLDRSVVDAEIARHEAARAESDRRWEQQKAESKARQDATLAAAAPRAAAESGSDERSFADRLLRRSPQTSPSKAQAAGQALAARLDAVTAQASPKAPEVEKLAQAMAWVHADGDDHDAVAKGCDRAEKVFLERGISVDIAARKDKATGKTSIVATYVAKVPMAYIPAGDNNRPVGVPTAAHLAATSVPAPVRVGPLRRGLPTAPAARRAQTA